MLWQFVRSIDKCYHWDFPKVVIFKCSTIGAMSSSFRKAAYLWSSSSKTSPKIWFLSKVSVLLLTANLLVITLPSSCWLLFNDSEQEQWLVPFVNHAVQSPLKAYLDPIHTSKMELLRKKLTASSIFAKNSILNVWLGLKYVAVYPRKFAKMQPLDKLSKILHKFASLIFFCKIVGCLNNKGCLLQ